MKLLEPLYEAVTFVMVSFHTLFKSIGFDPAGGWAWGLSIVGLVVVIRILLIPLFVKQIKAQRGLQLLQPEVKKLQAKYKGRTDPESRQKQQQELMKLYRDNGTNPFASCLPILAQAPIFFALFSVLNGIGKNPPLGKGSLTDRLAAQAADASILGANISDKFWGAEDTRVQVVTALMIVLMSATTFITQKQLMTKNMPAGAMDNPFAQQQKILLYVFPLIFAVSGVNFPIGVLLYWLTTNLWSMGQQLYVIRRMPAPGSEAEASLQRRREARASRHGSGADGRDGKDGTARPAGSANGSTGAATSAGSGATTDKPTSPNGQPGRSGNPASRQRQQPRRQPRRKR